MCDAVLDGGGGTKALRQRISTRSTRKSKTKITKPKKLVDELENRVPSHKMGDGINEMWKEDMKESPTFFAFFKAENKEKNLKKEIFLYDANRVVLDGGSHDYYHASWVDGLGTEKAYVMAQAPLKNTVEDFDRLVQQTKPELIVWLEAKDSEETKLLWASKKPTPEKEPQIDGWEISQLTCGSLKTKIFALNGWIDDTKPPANLVDSIEKLRKYAPWDAKSSKETKQPMLIVCKDGASKSGIFTLIDYEMDRIKNKGKCIKLQDTVRHLRQQRSNIFDTFELFDAGLQLIVELAKKHV